MQLTLTAEQAALAALPIKPPIFLEGPAGGGKTTAAIARLETLLQQGIPANQILVFTPQRTLATPYRTLLTQPNYPQGAVFETITMGGLARRMIDLFWPLVAEQAGFADPHQPPVFLTLETAQYYMAQQVDPLLNEGYFSAVTLDRGRLYAQVVDNLNKAAVVGFPSSQIAERLSAAWVGDDTQRRIYEDVQHAANLFRQYCLTHNLLDFSLQVEIFTRLLWPHPTCRNYLTHTYRHLVADNIEEDVPVFHDLLAEWLPATDSALLIYDSHAGYRTFLGADPDNAYALKPLCPEQVTLNSTLVSSEPIIALEDYFTRALTRAGYEGAYPTNPRAAFEHNTSAYTPEMVNWAADEAARLVNEEHIPPGEIVILAPFLSDALRFALRVRLEQHDLPVQSHRPSRALEEEPATHCLLTLACLAHPQWQIAPSTTDVAYSLNQAIAGLDLIRSQLLAEILYRQPGGQPTLQSFEQINDNAQTRITFDLGQRYQRLRAWLLTYQAETAENPDQAIVLDHFLQRLFGELLSQPGFGFHNDFDAARVAGTLIDSIYKFRQVVQRTQPNPTEISREYLRLVQGGLIAALYVENWEQAAKEAIFLAPAYTFLLSNRPVRVQFWLNANSRGWAERLYQPLTQPYVLSRHWPAGQTWRDENEIEANQRTLNGLVTGLLRRCRQKIYIGLSELDEQGYDTQGSLLSALQQVLRHAPAMDESA